VEALRERFGKYHVLDKLAQGGMAEVYKVKTVGIAGFEKIQALKRILPSSAREGRFIRSFIDEARIAVELTHRNIVQVFDFGKADGELFLAMELIEGKDLRTAMSHAAARGLPCPVAIAAYIISEAGAGLDYAHRKTDGFGGTLGIVHCDVSPSNVMLSTDGYVKILDFGIARASFSSALERRRLRGKPRYMSPEQTRGEPPTAATDVFALGIIAWELLTGQPLFRGPDLRSILEAVRTTRPARVDALNPAVPVAIADAVTVALSRDPAHRGTAADLATACARTALHAGAGGLAAWLGGLEAAGDAVAPWHGEPDATSISVRQGAPTAPPSRRSSHGGFDENAATATGTSGPRGFTRAPLTTPGASDPTVRLSAFADADPTTASHAPRLRDLASGGFDDRAETTTAGPRAVDDARTPVSLGSGVDLIAGLPVGPAIGSAGGRARASAPVLAGLGDPTAPEAPRYRDGDGEPAREDRTAAGPPAGLAPPGADEEPDEPGEPGSDDDLVVEGERAAPSRGGATGASDASDASDAIDDDLGAMTQGVLAERRRTVVVAATVDGADLEALRVLARGLGELSYQRGGVVLSLEERGLVVAFGLEVAGEDDVAIAMAWALDAGALVRDALPPTAAGDAAGAAPTLRVAARAGVATTTDAAGRPQVPAEAIDEARALARDATPDRPLFAGSTGRLTSALYVLREAPPRRAVARRARVLELLGRRGVEERDAALSARRGRFVGRATALATLDAQLARATTERRRVTVLVVGAVGAGKTRLLAEFAARATAATPGLRVISAATSPASRLAPFALVIELYQAALGLAPSRGRAARAHLVGKVGHLLAHRAVPEASARAVAIDLDRAMELRDGVGLGGPEIADLRPRISAGLATFRAALAAEAPALISIIEDVHQADGASLEVLRHTLAAPAAGAELLILTARPEGATPPAVEAVIELGDLVGGELRALIVDRLGPAATPVNVAAVIARGGGNPLFVEELTQAVREAGPELPATARDVIAARVDRLSPPARTALRYAAVIGGTVRARLLEELLGEGAEPASEPPADGPAPVAGALEELEAAGLLTRIDPRAPAASEGELAFPRGLVREVVYDALGARTRRDAHARIGRLLASRFFAGREEPPAVIAEHLASGGEPAAAAAFYLRAGQLALTAFDADAAVAHFTRTLTLEQQLGATPPTPPSRVRRREAHAGREEAHRLQGDLASHPEDLEELVRLCAGDPARLADAATRRAQRLLRRGDYPGALAATLAADAHATAAGDERLRGESLRLRGEVYERQGHFDEALAAVGQARAVFARIGATAEEIQTLVGRGRIQLIRADYEAARDAYRPVIARIHKTGDPWLERIVKNHVAVIQMCLGNFASAMASAERSLELCRRYGDRAREGDARSVAGIILLEVGRYDEAAATFTEALAVLAQTGSRWSHTDCLIYAGVADVRRGVGGGRARIDEALAAARGLGARYLEANALVSRAGAALFLGDHRAARDDAAAGVEAAQAATLVGYEIQGLARGALARARLGPRGLVEAEPLVHRALALLERQRHLEGSEEEVRLACATVLQALGDHAAAAAVLAEARAGVARKLKDLADPTWRAAFEAIAENRALRAE
jgi:serine/threonine protein kinase/tetratricopeptide (TPR) repeat protein